MESILEWDGLPRKWRYFIAACLAISTAFSGEIPALTVALIVSMFLVLLYRSTLRLDSQRRTYRRAFGVIPFVKVRQGTIYEVECLKLEIKNSAEDMILPNQRPYDYFTLRLVFKVGDPSIEVYRTSEFVEISALAAQLSQAFDWPVQEGPVLQKQRALFGDVPYELPPRRSK